MTYGIKIQTGTGAIVEYGSDNRASGVFLDSFTVALGATVSRTYPNFQGTYIFVQAYPTDTTKSGSPAITINQAGKSVSVFSTTAVSTWHQTPYFVLVFGR